MANSRGRRRSGADSSRDVARRCSAPRPAAWHNSPAKPPGLPRSRCTAPFFLRRVLKLIDMSAAQNAFRAPVVPLELHDPHVGIIALELGDVFQIRSAPTVNRLIGVAGHRQVRDDRSTAPARSCIAPDSYPDTHRPAGSDTARRAWHAFRGSRAAAWRNATADRRNRRRLKPAADCDTPGRRAPPCPQRMSGARLIVFGRNQVVFGPTDGRRDPLGREKRRVDPQIVQRPPQHVAAVGGVVDGEIFRQPDQRRILSQQPAQKR